MKHSIKRKTNFREVRDEEMALPGTQVSKEQLHEWLNKADNSKPVSVETLLKRLNRKLYKFGK